MKNDKDLMSYVVTLPQNSPRALMASSSKDYPEKEPFYSGVLGLKAHELPAANILHKINTINHEMTLYLNYPPSDIELGMAWRAGKIKNVFFVDSHNPLVIGQYKIDVDGFRLHTPCELKDVTKNNEAQQTALEESEPRLAASMSPLKLCSERTVSDKTINALGRGLNITPEINDERDERKINEDFMRITTSLVDKGWSSKDGKIKPQDRVSGNNIGAIMVDKDNKIIGWGLNLKSENKTFHAETLMIQRYLKENNTDKLPDGVKIFTSLECCHMCSAHITTLGNNIKVIYAQKDPYFNGENTLSQEKNGCSQERTTLNFPDIFKATMENDQDILDFLFSETAKQIFSRGYQDAALFIELMEAVAKNKQLKSKKPEPKNPTISPIMQYGENFLEALGNYTFKNEDSISPLFFRSRSPSPTREPNPREEQNSTEELYSRNKPRRD